MSEFIETRIPIILNSELEQSEMINQQPEYTVSKARVSLDWVKMIYESTYYDDLDAVGIDYHNGESITLIDKYSRIIDAHNVYLLSIKNGYLIKAQ